MMRIALLIFCFLIVPALTARATGLDQLVQQLQEKSDDTALREQIIKQAQAENPAIPEDARQHFVEGTAFSKAAENEKQQKLAVESFKKAVEIAPWWGDAYYNLAFAQELAGQFEDAQSSLKFYMLTNPEEKKSRAAQDKIYELSAKKKLAQEKSLEKAEQAAQKKATQEAETRAEEDTIWTGSWNRDRYDDGEYMMTTTVQSHKNGNTVEFIDGGLPFLKGTISGTEVTSWEVKKGPCGWGTLYPQVSADRRTIQYQLDFFNASTCTPSGGLLSITLTRQ